MSVRYRNKLTAIWLILTLIFVLQNWPFSAQVHNCFTFNKYLISSHLKMEHLCYMWITLLCTVSIHWQRKKSNFVHCKLQFSSQELLLCYDKIHITEHFTEPSSLSFCLNCACFPPFRLNITAQEDRVSQESTEVMQIHSGEHIAHRYQGSRQTAETLYCQWKKHCWTVKTFCCISSICGICERVCLIGTRLC